MASLAETVYGTFALCSFAPGAAGAYNNSRGFNAAFTRNGVGDYSLNITEPVALATEATIEVTPVAAALANAVVELVSTTVIRVRCFDAAGAAADIIGFNVRITKIGPN